MPTEDTAGIPGHQFIFEPSPVAVLESLIPRYIATRLFQAVLESKASEESSRMIAMKNATDNAEDLIEDLCVVGELLVAIIWPIARSPCSEHRLEEAGGHVTRR